jgi:hypothetical protein
MNNATLSVSITLPPMLALYASEQVLLDQVSCMLEHDLNIFSMERSTSAEQSYSIEEFNL